jgi:hypothetical protein
MNEEKKSIAQHMNEHAEKLSLFKINTDDSLVEKAKSLPVRELETIDSLTLSKYVIALSQYLVFLTSQVNKSRVMYKIHSRKFEMLLYKAIKDVTGKTLTEKKAKALEGNKELQYQEEQMHIFDLEVEVVRDIEKNITLLVNAIKRELTRREAEIGATRTARRM